MEIFLLFILSITYSDFGRHKNIFNKMITFYIIFYLSIVFSFCILKLALSGKFLGG